MALDTDETSGIRPLRILQLAAPGRYGGLERVLHALAKGLQSRGHHVTTAALLELGQDEPPLLQALRDAGVDVRLVTLPGRSYRAQVAAVRQLCATLAPDVVHSHGYVADCILSLSKARTTPRLVTTAHGFTGGNRKNRVYEWLQMRAHRRFDAVVAVSGGVRDRLERAGVSPGSVHVVRNAWDAGGVIASRGAARAELGIHAGTLSIGWVGRVSHEKGLDVMVRALPLLAALPVRLSVVGDGPEVARVEALAASLGVSDRVVRCGVVPDAGRLLQAFDVVVLSSRTEGTPIILLEAMSARVPIVATTVGGVPDVVCDREALLVPSDDPPALAAAVRAALTDRRSAEERAERARARLERAFALTPWLERYERIYAGAPPLPVGPAT